MEQERIVLTDNGKRVLKFLQESDKEELVGKDIGDELSLKGIYPVLTSLINKNLVTKVGTVKRTVVNSKGKEVEKQYITYGLTDIGRSFVIEQNKIKKVF